MKIRAICHGAVLALSAAATVPAAAFNADGHQAIGALADKLLAGSAAAAQVKSLLGGMSLQTAATWADCVKAVSTKDGVNFVYKSDDKLYPECIPFGTPKWKARNESFVQRNWSQCGSAHGTEWCHNQYHYADISTRRERYDPAFVGANDHDVVHAINAAVAVLRDQAPAAPFQIADKLEALMLLAHYVGDLHQPLHVEAIYLDAAGRTVDPDRVGYALANDTGGGNLIYDGSVNFHREWDAIPERIRVGGAGEAALLAGARAVAPTTGDIAGWSTQWATQTIVAGKGAFDRLRFAANPSAARQPEWTLWQEDDTYRADADALKTEQVAKAGARLAQLLRAIWPDAASACGAEEAPAPGYLAATALPDVARWLPPAPTAGSGEQALDDAIFARTRAELATPRGASAAADDVYAAPQVLARFQDSTGVVLTPANAPTLVALIGKAQKDAAGLLAPLKKKVCAGGRVRPFVAQPSAPSCLAPVDLAGKKHEDLDLYFLDRSGSYPSGHALLGMFVGLLFTELTPQHAQAALGRGLEFGESRVVCGFHYQSDVDAGRLAAAALLARLRADPAFDADLRAARAEVAAAGGR